MEPALVAGEMSVAERIARQVRARIKPPHGGLRDIPGFFAQAVVERQWRARAPARPHSLPKPLVVSLTSYPPRFRKLPLSLKCLLNQTVKPDAIVLWLAEQDVALLSDAVLRLCREEGVAVHAAPDLRSYNKIVPSLEAFPDAYILTADDDVYYWRTWLAELVEQADGETIRCHRAHRIELGPEGLPAPYVTWRFNVAAGPPSARTFATGVGGVLYPPHSLHPDVIDAATFMRLCPTNDDLWLYWMTRRAGRKVQKIGPRRRFMTWPGTQRRALQHDNIGEHGNDPQMAALIAHYGWPGVYDGADAEVRDRALII